MKKQTKGKAVGTLILDWSNKRPSKASYKRVLTALQTLELDEGDTVQILVLLGYHSYREPLVPYPWCALT